MSAHRIVHISALVGALLAFTGCGGKPESPPAPKVETRPEPPQPKLPIAPAPPKNKEPVPPPVADPIPPLTATDTAKLEALQKAGAGVHGPEADGGFVVRFERDTKLESALASLRGLKCVTNLTFDTAELTDDSLAAIEGLEHLNALVLYQCRQVTGAGFAVLPKLVRLKTLNAVGCLTNAACKHLAGVTSLRELRLIDTNVTDAGLRELSTLPVLDTLELEAGSVTGSCFTRAGWSKLRDLRAVNTPFTDVGLEAVAGLPALEELTLDATKVTDAGAKHLDRAKKLTRLSLNETAVGDSTLAALGTLPALTELSLEGTLVTDDGVAALASVGTLRALKLNNNTRVTGRAFAKFPKPSALRKLSLDDTAFGDASGAHLARFTALTTLSLKGCPVTDAGLTTLPELKKLTQLDVSRSQAGDGIAKLAGTLPELAVATFDGTALTDAGLRAVAAAPRLRFLSARGTKVTKRGAAEAIRFGPPGLRDDAEAN